MRMRPVHLVPPQDDGNPYTSHHLYIHTWITDHFFLPFDASLPFPFGLTDLINLSLVKSFTCSSSPLSDSGSSGTGSSSYRRVSVLYFSTRLVNLDSPQSRPRCRQPVQHQSCAWKLQTYHPCGTRLGGQTCYTYTRQSRNSPIKPNMGSGA